MEIARLKWGVDLHTRRRCQGEVGEVKGSGLYDGVWVGLMRTNELDLLKAFAAAAEDLLSALSMSDMKAPKVRDAYVELNNVMGNYHEFMGN